MCTCIGGTRVPATELIGAISTLWECSALIFNGCFWSLQGKGEGSAHLCETVQMKDPTPWGNSPVRAGTAIQTHPQHSTHPPHPRKPSLASLWHHCIYLTAADYWCQHTSAAATSGPHQLGGMQNTDTGCQSLPCRANTHPCQLHPLSSRAVPLHLGSAHGSVFNLKLLPMSISKRQKKKKKEQKAMTADIRSLYLLHRKRGCRLSCSQARAHLQAPGFGAQGYSSPSLFFVPKLSNQISWSNTCGRRE